VNFVKTVKRNVGFLPMHFLLLLLPPKEVHRVHRLHTAFLSET